MGGLSDNTDNLHFFLTLLNVGLKSMNNLLNYLYKRAMEPSSWRGLIFLIGGTWSIKNPEAVNMIVTICVTFVGLLGVFLPDTIEFKLKKNTSEEVKEEIFDTENIVKDVVEDVTNNTSSNNIVKDVLDSSKVSQLSSVIGSTLAISVVSPSSVDNSSQSNNSCSSSSSYDSGSSSSSSSDSGCSF